MRRAFMVLTIGFAACRDQANVQDANVRPAAAGGGTPTAVGATALVFNDSAMWQDPSCEVDTTYAHSTPGQLIREFVERNDSLGFFAGGGEANDRWLEGAEECPGHAGGSDGAAVVRSYTIDSLRVDGDSAHYVVRYELLGSTTPGTEHMRFVPEARSLQDTVRLIRTPYGWRITGDVGDPFMSPSAVVRQANLDAPSMGLLDSAIRAVARPSRPAPNER